MTLYADPRRCPDCQGPLPVMAATCPRCRLPLRGETAQRLFEALRAADELLKALRAESVALPVPDLVTVAALPAPAGPPAAAAGQRRGLSAASVPRILLTLGAGCLLVAALVFLAVTWSVMGVGGRTATLVGFTVVAGGLSGWMARRGLRGAAEALGLVGLGLLSLDVVGARHAGWLGDLGAPGFLVLHGAVLLAAGAGAAVAVRRTPARVLTGAQVVSAIGTGVLGYGLAAADDWATLPARLVLAVLVAALAALTARRLGLGVAALGAAVTAGLAWIGLVGYGLMRVLDHATLAGVWLHLEGWPVLAAVGLAALVGLARSLPVGARVGGCAVAVALLAVLVAVPAHGSRTGLTLTVLALLLVVGAGSRFVPRPWRPVGALWLVLGGGWCLAVAASLAGRAVQVLARTAGQAWRGSPDGQLVVPPAPEAAAVWLLPVLVAAVAGVALVLVHVAGAPAAATTWANRRVAAALMLASVVAALALYPVPVWCLAAAALAAGAGFLVWWLRTSATGLLVAAGCFLAAGVAVAAYDTWLTAVALLVLLVAAAVAHLRASDTEASAVAGAVLSAAAAGSAWTWAALAELTPGWSGAAALVVLAGLALAAGHLPAGWWRAGSAESARAGVEVGAAAAALPVGLAGMLAAAPAAQAGWAAAYLTVAGVATCVSALLRDGRRHLGWVGGALLAAASWVRLGDLGVHQPEAYTLPAAVALAVVGVLHLRRHPRSSTRGALGAALGLGLVPSLLWVWWEPATLRALLLGVACLGLVLAGLRLRWSAPVAAGALVGALVVLRHAAPMIGEAVPRWVLIGAAGAVLIAMGATWERRLQEARQVVGYVRSLR